MKNRRHNGIAWTRMKKKISLKKVISHKYDWNFNYSFLLEDEDIENYYHKLESVNRRVK